MTRLSGVPAPKAGLR